MKTYDEVIKERRMLLKSEEPTEDWATGEYDSHQQKGIPPPPLEKHYSADSHLIDLVKPDKFTVGNISLLKAVNQRQSRRKYTREALTLEELSFLLWVTQGVKSIDKNKVWTKRTVPSGGSRHPYETYLIVNRVEGLEPAVYRYLPIEHKLLPVKTTGPEIAKQLSEACEEQTFVGESAVVFVWAAIPYRTEWRYSIISHRDLPIEAGHICQNLYLACEAIGAGTCAILAYHQKLMDSLIDVDGEDEFTVYLALVGKI